MSHLDSQALCQTVCAWKLGDRKCQNLKQSSQTIVRVSDQYPEPIQLRHMRLLLFPSLVKHPWISLGGGWLFERYAISLHLGCLCVGRDQLILPIPLRHQAYRAMARTTSRSSAIHNSNDG
jgi:hypothetical protein